VKRRERHTRCVFCGRKGHVLVSCPDLEPTVPEPTVRQAQERPEVQEEMARRRAGRWSRET
jgi:hypothetical protein